MKKRTLVIQSLFLLTLLLNITYMFWRGIKTIPKGFGIASLVFGILFFLMELFNSFQSIEYFYNSKDDVTLKLKRPSVSFFPEIDIFITTEINDISLIRKTINACINMEYTDKKKVNIFLCDDYNNRDLRILADKMNVGYISRTTQENGRAGCLNNALSETKSPIIVIFDGDMIPKHNFLTTCVPYFNMTKVGFVQTPKSYYNPDLFSFNLYSEKRIPDEQYHFYKDIQISKNKSNSVVFCGTNVLVSREALEDIHGFYTKTSKEDFVTGVLIQSQGYNCYAVEETLVTGLAPTNLKELIAERRTLHVNGIASGKKTHAFFRKGLTISQRFSYLSSILYWYNPLKRFIFLILPIVASIFAVKLFDANIVDFLLLATPVYLLNIYTLSRLSKGRRTQRWNMIYETIMAPFLLLPSLFAFLGINIQVKNPKSSDEYSSAYGIPHIILATLTIVGMIFSIASYLQTRNLINVFIFAWLVVNLYNILMSVFFVFGRVSKRKAPRFRAKVRCILSWDNMEIECKTFDISENGFSMVTEFPHYIPYNKKIETFFIDNRFISKFTSEVVNVSKLGSRYKYSAKITDIGFEEQNRLYGIIYDKEPTYPTVIADGVGFINDFLVNIKGRIPKPDLSNRKLARVELDQYMKDTDNEIFFVKDFNYEYISLETTSDVLKENIVIPVTEDLELYCRLDFQTLTDKKNEERRYVYRILNSEDLVNNINFTMVLRNWIGIKENHLQQKLLMV